MNIEDVREYCLAKKAASESFPFDNTVLAFKVMDRMFAVLWLTDPDKLVLKCDPEYAEELREQYDAIEPAWHFNKRYWNQLRMSHISGELLRHLIDHSYDEVVKKFPKKKKEELDKLK